jgi:hypothetical protein
MKRRAIFFAVFVLGFCAWQSRDLLVAWRHAPFDRADPVAFAIWLVPVAFAWAHGRINGLANSTWLLVAAAASLLGAITDLHLLPQLALAFALASFLPANTSILPWLLAAVAWMPVLGWGSSAVGLGWPAVTAVRLLLALPAAIWECRLLSATNAASTP